MRLQLPIVGRRRYRGRSDAAAGDDKAMTQPFREVNRIVFFGTFGPPSLTFARSCSRAGISVYLLSVGGSGAGSVPSRCFAGVRSLDRNLAGKTEGIEAILRYASEVRADALATISEAHSLWLARNRAHFENVCTLMAPAAECLERLASKSQQIRLAQEAGLTTLPTYFLRQASEARAIASGHYPVCLRPSSPDCVDPAFKVLTMATAGDLERYLGSLSSLRGALVAQPLRVLPNMVVHCTSGADGGLLRASAFLVDRKFEGLALRIRGMPTPEGLGERISRFSRMAGLEGPYHFDFLYSAQERQCYFLEVNARFGGTTDKVRWLGVDEPAECLEAYGLRPPDGFRSSQRRFTAVVNKRATLKHLLTSLRRGQDPTDYPQESRIRGALHSVGDMFLAKDSIWDWRDLRGTLAFHLQGVTR